jgi:hypothetical protein
VPLKCPVCQDVEVKGLFKDGTTEINGCAKCGNLFISLMVPIVLVLDKKLRRFEDALIATPAEVQAAIKQAESLKIIKGVM